MYSLGNASPSISNPPPHLGRRSVRDSLSVVRVTSCTSSVLHSTWGKANFEIEHVKKAFADANEPGRSKGIGLVRHRNIQRKSHHRDAMAKTDQGRSLVGYYTPDGYRMAHPLKMIPQYLASSHVVIWGVCAGGHALIMHQSHMKQMVITS